MMFDDLVDVNSHSNDARRYAPLLLFCSLTALETKISWSRKQINVLYGMHYDHPPLFYENRWHILFLKLTLLKFQ